jgi:hypothetical protein
MRTKENGNAVDFIEHYCRISGRFGDKIYRRKRNGMPWVYDYKYVPKYPPTVLSRRTNCVVKVAALLSNPQHKGYGEILNKLYYYTPYYVYPGSYSFTCNTFFKLRKSGQYTLDINGVRLEMNLSPRTKLKLNLIPGTIYVVKCFRGDFLYSERQIVVIDEEENLEAVYSTWFDEHLEEILLSPEPQFRALQIYRRGVESPVWLQYLTGKTESGVLYRSKRERFMYIRKHFEQPHTESGNYFYEVQVRVSACWNAVSPAFRQTWSKYHIRWFDEEYRRDRKAVKQNNLWSRLIFFAGGILGFDLTELAVDNWLPGVNTLGDLLQICEMQPYGLSAAELEVDIF